MDHARVTDRPTGLFYQSTDTPAVGGVTLAGFIRHSNGLTVDPMRVFGRYALVLLVDGEGFFADALGTRLTITPGDLILVFPDISHTYGPLPQKHWSECFMVFEGPVFDAWRTSGMIDPSRPRWKLGSVEPWLRRMESIVEHANPMTAMMRLQQFLVDAIEQVGRTASAVDDHAWLADARRLLDATITDHPLQVEEVAEQVGLSYELFRKKFAKLTGLPPAKFRDARRIDRASQLLQDRQLPLKQIALRCGFCDEFHFSKRFKQKIGLSPSEYRQRLP